MASLLWTSVFGILIIELILTLILVVPVPIKVRNFLARKVSSLDLKTKLSKPILFIAIGLFLALLESFFTHRHILYKIAELDEAYDVHGDMIRHHHYDDKERKYKAERNMYLAGFALTLIFVIGRLTQLNQEHVELEEECERYKTIIQSETTTTTKSETDKKKD